MSLFIIQCQQYRLKFIAKFLWKIYPASQQPKLKKKHIKYNSIISKSLLVQVSLSFTLAKCLPLKLYVKESLQVQPQYHPHKIRGAKNKLISLSVIQFYDSMNPWEVDFLDRIAHSRY